jgi:hypothetical protein
MKALEHAVTEEQIAQALDLDVKKIIRGKDLLEGVPLRTRRRKHRTIDSVVRWVQVGSRACSNSNIHEIFD